MSSSTGRWELDRMLVEVERAKVVADGSRALITGHELPSWTYYWWTFLKENGQWRLVQKVRSPVEEIALRMDMEGDTLLAGSPGADGKSGVAYIFVWEDEQWKLMETLRPLFVHNGQLFGLSVDLADEYALVSSYGVATGGRGAAHIFKREPEGWTGPSVLLADGHLNNFTSYRGDDVALDGEIALVLQQRPEPKYQMEVVGYSLPVNVSNEPTGPVHQDRLMLGSLFPNPFTASTQFPISLPAPAYVDITIFDILGRHVETLEANILPAGDHTFQWRPTRLRGGVYLLRLLVDGEAETRKMIYVR